MWLLGALIPGLQTLPGGPGPDSNGAISRVAMVQHLGAHLQEISKVAT